MLRAKWVTAGISAIICAATVSSVEARGVLELKTGEVASFSNNHTVTYHNPKKGTKIYRQRKGIHQLRADHKGWLVMGNHKMELMRGEAAALVIGIRPAAEKHHAHVQTAVYPSSNLLNEVSHALVGGHIAFGSQGISHKMLLGAETGSISLLNNWSYGASTVVIGHSEHRARGLSNEHAAQQAVLAWRGGLHPVFCIGEPAGVKWKGTNVPKFVQEQIGALLKLLPRNAVGITLAYEPLEAIGSGQPLAAAEANRRHALIRNFVAQTHPLLAKSMKITYGGSVKPGQITEELAKQPHINGVLVGGASLKADSFNGIIESAAGVLSR